ncbi:MAG: hypothetical protein K6E50_04220 [Lachnospiraceae bacterium]|nr:hypothetical protein [Lachnospiraceae bacterium]
MKRIEDFPVDPALMRELTEECAKRFGPLEVSSKKYVYVNLSMVRLQTVWFMPKLIYARAICEACGAGMIVLTWKENELFTKLVEAFGGEHVALDTMCRKDPAALLATFGRACSVYMKGSDVEGFRKMKLWGLPVGRVMYEDILRTSSLSTIRTLRDKTVMKKTIHILWMCHALKHYFKKKPPLFSVGDDIAYHEGIQHAMFKQAGAEVYCMSDKAEAMVLFDSEGRVIRRGEMRHRRLAALIDRVDYDEEKALKALEDRFHGKIPTVWDRGAFVGKKVMGREELMKQLGLDPAKKNIVIMAHTFTDAVFNYGELYFRDYYDWTEKTLRIASETKDVNWILKPHPSRKSYNESTDSIEDMYRRYRRDNIFLMPDDVSSESLRGFADCVITIGGNAGAEFACCGIPAVIVGFPYYRGFGYTLEPKDYSEYEKLLRGISSIEPLTEEQTRMARKVFYVNGSSEMKSLSFQDEPALLLKELYGEMIDAMAVEYYESNKGTKKFNDRITKELTKYMASHDMRQSEYFRRGEQRGREATWEYGKRR